MEHGKTENVFNTKQIPDRTEQNKKTKKNYGSAIASYLVNGTLADSSTVTSLCYHPFVASRLIADSCICGFHASGNVPVTLFGPLCYALTYCRFHAGVLTWYLPNVGFYTNLAWKPQMQESAMSLLATNG
ncbi:Y+L amino acid transporter [Trichinella pseudospiralis]